MQLRLRGLDPPRQVQPSTDRPDSALWVPRIQVLRALKAGPEHVVRDVELRRGLNIVWAPPHQSSNGNTLFQNGVAGHTAGKTTFCRLIRYVLGERGFATEGIRKRIREKFPAGWVIAEVMVGGQLWTVARPLGLGPHSFCVEGSNIEQTVSGRDRLDYQRFLDAVARVTVEELSARHFPTTDESVRWGHILPWLTRDQECRFAHFLEWRHSASSSEAPTLNSDERQFVVRSVLGLITDEERKEQQENARLVSEKREAAQKEPLLTHQAAVDHARVESLLGLELPLPLSGLFGRHARGELQRQTDDVEKQLLALSSADQRAELQVVLEKAIQSETNTRRDLTDSEARLDMEATTLDLLSAQTRGEDQVDLLATLPPAREFCNVRMKLARERGCPLANSRPFDLMESRSERRAVEELENQRKLVSTLESTVEQNRNALAAAEAETRQARKALLAAATSYDDQRGRLLEQRARLAYIERCIVQAEEAWTNAAQQKETVTKVSASIEASYSLQEQLRNKGLVSLHRFSATFDYVVRAIIGEEVEARVDTSGRSLSLIVEHNGERESAALATVKLLAFDLAALTASVEGQGSFPRFLVHDGPREADLAPDIYERLFLYVRQLEDCFEGDPSFQYILTTTTRPPDECLREPWLRLRLAGTPADERYLRTDL